MPADLWLLLPFMLLGALLYSSVGHGGATVYLAILTLAGHTVAVLATTVLVLNIVAAGIAFAFFRHAGHLRPRLLWPFLLTSVPAAYLGGSLDLTLRTQEWLLGIALAVAALRLLCIAQLPEGRIRATGPPFWILAPLSGAVLGLLAGIIGIGGGIFLSPLLVFLRWADVREAGAVAAAFIVLNSAAALAARIPRIPVSIDLIGPLVLVVTVGALIGAFVGARRLPPRALQVALGIVLVVASLKALLPMV